MSLGDVGEIALFNLEILDKLQKCYKHSNSDILKESVLEMENAVASVITTFINYHNESDSDSGESETELRERYSNDSDT